MHECETGFYISKSGKKCLIKTEKRILDEATNFKGLRVEFDCEDSPYDISCSSEDGQVLYEHIFEYDAMPMTEYENYSELQALYKGSVKTVTHN